MVIIFFIFLRNFHAIYQSGHTNLHSHQNAPGIPFIHIITFFFLSFETICMRDALKSLLDNPIMSITSLLIVIDFF